jgi:REP element-mobilizing transposase RayT
MGKATELPRRKSPHLGSYDYTSSGYYFVTICSHNKHCLFGSIDSGVVRLNEMGIIIDASWQAIPDHFATVTLDEYVVMPNHVHGIIRLCNTDRARHASPLREKEAMSLGAVIGSFKSAVTK